MDTSTNIAEHLVSTWAEEIIDNSTVSSTADMIMDTAVITPPPLDWVDNTELILLALMGVFGTPGNGLIVLVQLRTQDKISTDFLVATMATFDLIDSSLNTIMGMLHTGLRAVVLSAVFCPAVVLLMYWTAMVSALFIGFLAVDRYLLTCHPLNTVYTVHKAKILCAFMPLLGIGLSIPYAQVTFFNTDIALCDFSQDAMGEFVFKTWSQVVVLIILLIFIVTSIAYFKIALKLRSRVQKSQSKPKRTKKRDESNISEQMVGMSDASDNHTPSAVSVKDVEISNIEIPRKSAHQHQELDDDYSTSVITTDTEATVENHEAFEENTNTVSGNIVNDETCQDKTVITTDGRNHINKEKKSNNQKMKEKVMNRTTRILFFISLIYMVSWATSSFLLVTKFNIFRPVQRLMYLFRRVNIVTNPILFICMSSKFRDGVKKICSHRTQSS